MSQWFLSILIIFITLLQEHTHPGRGWGSQVLQGFSLKNLATHLSASRDFLGIFHASGLHEPEMTRFGPWLGEAGSLAWDVVLVSFLYWQKATWGERKLFHLTISSYSSLLWGKSKQELQAASHSTSILNNREKWTHAQLLAHLCSDECSILIQFRIFGLGNHAAHSG